MSLLHGLLLLTCAGAVSDGAQQYATLTVVRDFAREQGPDLPATADGASVSCWKDAGGTARRSILLRPGQAGRASLDLDAVTVPSAATPSFLFFATAVFRVSSDHAPKKLNPVRFRVSADGVPVFASETAESRWHAHAVDLSPWAGRTLKLAFLNETTDGVDGGMLGIWGDPVLVSLTPAMTAFSEQTAGIAFVRAELPVGDTVVLKMGGEVGSFSLSAGTHWLPLEFKKLRQFSFSSASGKGEVKTVWIGARSPEEGGTFGVGRKE